MKRKFIPIFIALLMIFSGIVFAQNTSTPKLIPISAEQAFDAVQTQTDPITGDDKSILLVDVRSRAEFVWLGSACEVEEIITTKGNIYFPDLGKVLLSQNGRFLKFEINGRNKRLQTKKVATIKLTPIVKNIPLLVWNEDQGALQPNGSNFQNFKEDIESLAGSYDVLIIFCGNGQRSSFSVNWFNTELFDALYEIDQPDGTNGMGGFQGPEYSGVYNGYQGFPERLTEIQEYPSVSWKDTGLPIKTWLNPF